MPRSDDSQSGPGLRAILLGSGTSQGVPMAVCNCEVCRSPDPRDKRGRCSLYLQTPGGAGILVDTPPEFRVQAIRENLPRVDAALFTHEHADHLFGFDDLRQFCVVQKMAIPVHAGKETMAALRRNFYWAFEPPLDPGYVRVQAREFENARAFDVGGLTVTPLQVPHGTVATFGFLFSKNGEKLLAYFCDAKELPQSVRAAIQAVPVLILDGLRDEPHPTHLSIPESIETARAVQAGRTILTHLTHQKTHAQRSAELPADIELGYDGMQIGVAAA